MSQFSIRFFWGSRKESLGSSAATLVSILEELEKFDKGFSARWFPSGCAPEYQPEKELLLTPKASRAFITNCRIRDDFGNIIEDLGYSIDLANDAYIRTRLQLHIGNYSGTTDNSLLISLPNNSGFGKEMFKTDHLKALMERIIPILKPNYADVWSYDLLERLGIDYMSPIRFGWLTYFPEGALSSSPPEDFPLFLVPSYGAIAALTRQKFNLENSGHMARAKKFLSWLEGQPSFA